LLASRQSLCMVICGDLHGLKRLHELAQISRGFVIRDLKRICHYVGAQGIAAILFLALSQSLSGEWEG
jgi:hypothetical protein